MLCSDLRQHFGTYMIHIRAYKVNAKDYFKSEKGLLRRLSDEEQLLLLQRA